MLENTVCVTELEFRFSSAPIPGGFMEKEFFRDLQTYFHRYSGQAMRIPTFYYVAEKHSGSSSYSGRLNIKMHGCKAPSIEKIWNIIYEYALPPVKQL